MMSLTMVLGVGTPVTWSSIWGTSPALLVTMNLMMSTGGFLVWKHSTTPTVTVASATTSMIRLAIHADLIEKDNYNRMKFFWNKDGRSFVDKENNIFMKPHEVLSKWSFLAVPFQMINQLVILIFIINASWICSEKYRSSFKNFSMICCGS